METVPVDDPFTPAEWQTLQFAPFWIFSGLLGSYGNFDPLEYEAFVRALDSARAAPGRLAPGVITSIAADRDRLTEQFQSDRRTIALGLCEVASLLNRTSADESATFKQMLISTIGAGVARARGRFGREMSEDDEKTLDLIAQFLA